MYAFETLINFLTSRMYFIHNEYHHYNVRQHFINIGWSLQQSRKKEIYFVDWYMSDILNKLVIKIMCIVFFVKNFYYNSIFEIRSVYPNTQQQTTTQYCFSWYNSAYSRLHFHPCFVLQAHSYICSFMSKYYFANQTVDYIAILLWTWKAHQ